MRYTREIDTKADPRTALGFAANFLNQPIWDPSVTGVRKLSRGPVRDGTRFLVRFGFLGATTDLSYEVLEYDPGKRAVLKSNGTWATVTDTVTVEPTSEGSRLRWQAEIQLVTALAPFDPILGAVFGSNVDKAVAGLAASIDALARWRSRRVPSRKANRRPSSDNKKAA
jgi:carbon monoxide dehydrogenase subunit G